jgi:hypothetical protein
MGLYILFFGMVKERKKVKNSRDQIILLPWKIASERNSAVNIDEL